jgi:hypothetical protein
LRHLVTVIDWYGPYDFEGAKAAARKDFDSGLYMCAGLLPYQRGKPKIQYVGIAQKSMATRVNNRHHKLHEVTKQRTIWLGEVASLGSPGKKTKATNPSLDFAEWALVYFLKPALNAKKNKTPPARDVTVLNRWWKKDYETPYSNHHHADWPDLIDYLGRGATTRLVTFKNIKRVVVPE